jgi:hypothetical protein
MDTSEFIELRKNVQAESTRKIYDHFQKQFIDWCEEMFENQPNYCR